MLARKRTVLFENERRHSLRQSYLAINQPNRNLASI